MAVIANSVFVYQGSFHMPLLAAHSHAASSQVLMISGRAEDAVREGEAAATLSPTSVEAQASYCLSLRADHNRVVAEKVCANAERLAQEDHYEFTSVVSAAVRELSILNPP